MNILITGATGFIGYNLYKYLKQFDSYKFILYGKKNENIITKDEVFYSDLSEIKIENDIDVVFHQAANNDTQEKNYEIMYKNNFEASVNLIKMAIKNNCKKFIYASSCAVYGNSTIFEENSECVPLTPYGESKLIFDNYIKDNKEINFVGLRYSNVYGKFENHKSHRMSMISQIINSVKNNLELKLFEFGEQERDWVYIDDVIKANILSMSLPNGIYNVGFGKSRTFNEILEIVNKKLNKDVKPEYIKNKISSTYQSYTCANIDKLKKFGYEPFYNIEKGIDKLIQN